MSKTLKKNQLRLKRKLRIRKKITGSAERPRLSVFKSTKHIYAQVIDDDSGRTLVSVGSFSDKASRCDVDKCSELGKLLAAKCAESKVTSVVFDKNGYAYHGRIKAFADGAREGGLRF